MSESFWISYKKTSCISGASGTGKTLMLISLAKQILQRKINRLVRFIFLREFVSEVQKRTRGECEINKELLINIIAGQASQSEFGKDVVRELFKCENHKKILFFDGYDEILPNQKETCNQILQIVRNWKSVELFITTQSHALTELENIFGIVGYTIWQVKDELLIKYFETAWGKNGTRRNERLNDFAKKCLSSLRRNVSEFFECEMIAGRPFQCSLLREILNDKAIEYSKERSKIFEFDIASLFDLYKKVVEIWMHKFKPSMRKSPEIKAKIFANGHMYAALKYLFPEHALKFKDILVGDMEFDTQELYASGILQKKETLDDNETIPRFVHPTFAQYFLGLFITRMLAYHTDFNWKFFNISIFLDFFVESVLSVNELPVNLITSSMNICRSEPIKSYSFQYPVLSYFINAHLKRDENKNFGGISPWTKDSDKVYNVLSACLTHDFPVLYAHTAMAHTRLLQDNPSRLADLLLLSAKHSTLEQFKIVGKQAKDFLKTSTPSTSEFPDVTPLHVSVQRGHFSITNFLLNTYPESEWRKVKYLMHCCIAESIYDNDNIILEKIQIMKLISLKKTEFMNERLPSGMSPIFLPNLDLQLLECLITCGADLNLLHQDISLLHKLPEANNISPESYHDLVSIMLVRGFNHLNFPDSDQRTPFHLAMLKIELLEKTVKLFALYGANFHAIDESGDTILFYGVRGGRSNTLLSCVLSNGASIAHKNKENENILHICAKYGNYAALEHFLKFPEVGPNEVNGDDRWRSSPFILAMKHEKVIPISLINLMEEKGLKMTRKLASYALEQLNSKTFPKYWDYWEFELMDYLMDRGGRLWHKNQPRFDELSLSELRSDVLQKFFEPCVFQISYKWWTKKAYCSRKIQSFKFVDESVTHLEALITKQKSNTILDHLKRNITTEIACKWIHASVIGSHINLLKLMIELETHKKLVEFELEDLLVLAVKCANEAVIDEVKQIYEKQTRTKIQDFKLELVNDEINHTTYESILCVAALRGVYSVVNHLLNMYGFSFMLNEGAYQGALGFCVCDTLKLHDDQISERIRIIERLLQEYPAWIQINEISSPNPNHYLTSPLLYPDIHIDLLIHLIRLGINVHNVSKNSLSNILHRSPEYLTLDQYEKLVRELLRKNSQLFQSKDKYNRTPLHSAMYYLNLVEPILELFFSAKVDFTTKDYTEGVTPNEKDEQGWTPLHYAVYGSRNNTLEILQVLLQHGSDVHAIDKKENTPLHCIFTNRLFEQIKKIQHEVVEALLQHGADVNRANKKSFTSLKMALICNERHVIEKRTIELMKEASTRRGSSSK
ncbi:unnamed protein product [Orchesella dallaii]|uniref:NACHT domain-containing protein n=1 Tax=Orchesella dallaii TaxID=48710 RepID=A0ABP1RBD3_9HEXA